ncbi:unnamed protein product [Hymenolepis diminuta]|uniref:Uncharacterized protein n=1 Tax=Hymenolepis diminuta TaxID=6216 RepID=A0A564YP06_HYMDI|nr:unnamed protein product [Hymenolepis diminuta]
MFSRGPTQVTHIKLCFSMQGITHMCQLPAPTLPSRLLHSSALSPPLSLTRFNPRWDFPEYTLV